MLFPDILDEAVLRPGRLDKTLYIGLPTAEERTIILKTITKVCKLIKLQFYLFDMLVGKTQPCTGCRS